MSVPDDPRRPVSSGRGAPPPRRADDGRAGPGPARDPLSPAAPVPIVVGPGEHSDVGDRSPAPAERSSPARRARAPWWLRVLAWAVAVPLGLVLVGIPARELGYLDSQKLLDVVIGQDTGRYLPVVVIVLLWAVVTALLVQLIVEGGGWLLRRRRARRHLTA